MNELGIQSMIIRDYKTAHRGAMAYKQAHRFLAGVPDLRLAHRVTGEWNLEVKYHKVTPRVDKLDVGLTELQRRWGRNAIHAGMQWGWCLVFPIKGGYGFIAGADPDVDQCDTSKALYRRNGQGWNSYNPLAQIVGLV